MAEVTVHCMTPVPKPRRWRKRYGYFAEGEDGTVFLPGIVAGQELMVFLCASHDGTPMVRVDGVSLYPAEWLAREFPRVAKDVAHIVRRIREMRAKGAE